MQAENTLLKNEKTVMSREMENLRKELKMQRVINQELEDKSSDLQIKLKSLEDLERGNKELVQENSVLAEELKKVTHDFELISLQHKQAMEVIEKTCKDQQIESESVRSKLNDHSAQQNVGETSDTKDLSKIKERFSKIMSKDFSSVTKTNKCIKEFKYSVEYEKDEATGITRSNVTVTKGRIIMNYPSLTQFSGQGYNEESSKEDAFNQFISSVMNAV